MSETMVCKNCPDGDGWIYVPTKAVFRKGKETVGKTTPVRKTCPVCKGWGIVNLDGSPCN